MTMKVIEFKGRRINLSAMMYYDKSDHISSNFKHFDINIYFPGEEYVCELAYSTKEGRDLADAQIQRIMIGLQNFADVSPQLFESIED